MKKYLGLLLILLVVFSCRKNEYFTVEGAVENAADKALILEHVGLRGTERIDSVKLNEKGTFKLKGERPEYPDFYSLRIDNKLIRFAVDSTEVITINTSYDNFATEYTVEGSYNSEKIKDLRLSLMNIQKKVDHINKHGLMGDELEDEISALETMIETHKEMARGIIFEQARSTAAYFAIFQQINDVHVFSPYDPADYSYCAAVATAYNTFMPEYERSRNLYGYVLGALKERRSEQKNSVDIDEYIQSEAKGYIDIALPDRNNIERKLSTLEGKVVLIDFFAHELEGSADYIFALRDLYSKYNSEGFEIYQVSLDRNRMLWEISSENLPWVCVRSEGGVNNYYATLYNVSELPTGFLMDMEGNIISRDLNMNDLDREIAKLLK